MNFKYKRFLKGCRPYRHHLYHIPNAGDHPITAQAIAKQVGIIDQDVWDAGRAAVVKGDDIREILDLPEEKQRQRFDDIFAHDQLVFARVSPAHKLIIVENA